jgi:hypothetical protein
MLWTDDMRIVCIEERKKTSIKEHASQIILKDIESGSRKGATLDLSNGISVYLGNERKLSGFISTAIDFMVRDGEFIKQ